MTQGFPALSMGETFAVYIFFRPGFFNSDLIRIWIIIWDLSLEKLINRTQTFVRVTLVFEFKGAELKHEMMGKDLHCTNSALQLHNWGHTNVSNRLFADTLSFVSLIKGLLFALCMEPWLTNCMKLAICHQNFLQICLIVKAQMPLFLCSESEPC